MNNRMYIARATDVAARMIGDELMIMSGKNSSLFSLNETAAILWQAADGITPLDDIVEQKLCAEFDIDVATAMRDAEEMVLQLSQFGILQVSEHPLSDRKTTTET